MSRQTQDKARMALCSRVLQTPRDPHPHTSPGTPPTDAQPCREGALTSSLIPPNAITQTFTEELRRKFPEPKSGHWDEGLMPAL